ncbi:radical SAM protein [Nonomuraea candida]|uniref:radical SAM protein n=1 Tax=Nonomuraea candida TaxID=359159 RepID=UPI0005B9FF56|nr:radical SAM protein [Nonomuraea candida]
MTTTSPELGFLWLELTGKCQLDCVQCYADSGPSGTHGSMDYSDWISVIDQAAALGTRLVQFIGGEPTLHPGLPGLIAHALDRDVRVEVYSNLVHVTRALWETFAQPGVQLATSFYTDDPVQHRQITGRPTLARTLENITRALALNIPLRVGMVHVNPGQRIDEAKTLLHHLGVEKIGTDRLRVLGRPSRGRACDISELCGNCGRKSAAVLPGGTVTPCPLSRWMTSGVDVRQAGLPAALAAMRPHAEQIAATVRPIRMCGPDNDGQCNPCEPSCTPGCDPGVEDDG